MYNNQIRVPSIRKAFHKPINLSKSTCLHCQSDCVDHDEHKDTILKWPRSDQPPDFILYSVFWDVPSLWFCPQCELYALSLKYDENTLFQYNILLYIFCSIQYKNV